MADRVQFIMDRMAVTFREMEQFEVFTQEEVKSVVKKRTDYEYKLRRRQQTPADYYGYLQYELGLEELRVLRCRKQSKGNQEHNSDADFSKELINKHRKLQSAFMRHISYVFERALRRFPDHMPLWDDYIRFLQDKQANSTLNTVFGRALSLHPKNESLWLQAAVFEMNGNSNAHAARVLLQRALRVNKYSEKLWETYFELELWYVARGQERRRLLGLKAANKEPPTEGEEEEEEEQQQQLGVPWVVYRHATKNIPGLGFAMTLLQATGAGCAVSSSTGGGGVRPSSALQVEMQGDVLARFGGERGYWSAMVQLAAREHVSAFKEQQQQKKLATKKLQKKRSQQEAFSGAGGVEAEGDSGDSSSTGQGQVVSRLRAVAGGLEDTLALLEACRAAPPSAQATEGTSSFSSSSSFLAGCWCDVLAALSPVLSVPVHEDVSLSALDLFRSQQLGEGGMGPNVVEEVSARLDDAAHFLQGEGETSSQQEPLLLAARLSIATLQTILYLQYPEVLRNYNDEATAKNSTGSLENVISCVMLWLKRNATDVANIDVWTVLVDKTFRAFSVSELLSGGGGGGVVERGVLELCAAVLGRGSQLLNLPSHSQASVFASAGGAAGVSSDEVEELKTSVFAQAIEGTLLRKAVCTSTPAGSGGGRGGAGLCAVQRALEAALLGRAPVTRKESSESVPSSDRVYVSWLLRYCQMALLLQGAKGWREACEFVERRCLAARPHCVATLALDRYYEQLVDQGMTLLRAASPPSSSSSGSDAADALEDFVCTLVQAAVSRCPSSPSLPFLEAAEELQRRAGRHEQANHTRWKRARAL